MKLKILRQIYNMSRYAILGMILQGILATLLIAKDGNAQHKSLEEIYVSIDVKTERLEDALLLIEQKTDFSFVFNGLTLDKNQKISTYNENASLASFLRFLSKDAQLKFKRVNDNIYVSKKSYFQPALTEITEEPDPLQVVISGVVTSSEDSEPLPGVSIIIKGTNIGTTTDIEGRYALEASEGSVLQFSYIGYATQEIEVANQSTIDVALITDLEQLDEIVVVGYGTQRKVNLTGSVSSIASKQIEERPVPNTANLLAGLATGLNITQSTGIAGGDDPAIQIRGVGTLGNSSPLILVDGTEASINDVLPSDIESISVLKDGASAAIYGSRAAQGVILITTKRASKGLSVNYHGWMGFQGVAVRPDYITDGAQWMELVNEGWLNGGNPQLFTDAQINEYRNGNDPLRYPNTDWFDVLAGENAPMTNHAVTISGGSDKSTIRTSFNYLNQDGIGTNNKQERFGLRINNENKLAKNLTLGTNLFIRWSNITPALTNSLNEDALGLTNTPHIPTIQSPDGRWGGAQVDGIGTVTNWIATASVTQHQIKEQNMQGQIYANWEILEGLSFNAKLALNYFNSNNNYFLGLLPTGGVWNFNTGIGGGSDRGEEARSINNNNTLFTSFYTLNYTKSIKKHNFSVLAGYQFENFRSERLQGSIFEFPSNNTPVLSAGLENPGVQQSIQEWALISGFGRFTYNFQEKYLLEGNIRYDGSSRFRDGKKWGVFPSVSAAWRISEEAFLQDVGFISDMKVRASWGRLGNQQLQNNNGQIQNYPYQATYALNQNYSFGGNVALGIAQNDIANPDIQWETTTTYNIGLDLSLFNGKLNLTTEYYNRLTDGILVQQEIPEYLGWKGAPFENLAEVLNTGWEFAVTHRNNIGEFSYSAGLNLTIQNNELTKYLSDIPFITGSEQAGEYVLQEGQPIFATYGYRNIGVFQSEDEIENAPFHRDNTAPGDLIFEDLNGDDEITAEDRTIIGNTLPKYLVGANLGFRYKGFDFSLLLQGNLDVDIWTGVSEAFYPLSKGDRGQFHEVWLDRWTPENPSTSLHRLSTTSPFNAINSTFFQENGSFLRVKNLLIGYTIPIAKTEIDNIRVYVSSENLLTFSEFSRKWGHDPERNARQYGIRIPNVRTVVLGVNVDF
ncbi:MAG: SusC/RagA family TonB-linked outer membrane protein [Bacteroidota bacterium]